MLRRASLANKKISPLTRRKKISLFDELEWWSFNDQRSGKRGWGLNSSDIRTLDVSWNFWLKCSEQFQAPNPFAPLEQRSSYWEFLNESRVSIHLKGANDCKGLQWLDRSFARSSCGLYCTLCKRSIAILVLLCDSLTRIQHLVTMPQEASLFWWAEIGAWCSHFGTSTEIWR